MLFFRHFEVKNRDDAAESAMLFSVPDFVGDACKAIASRIRGSVASVQFDDFHKVGDFMSFCCNIYIQHHSSIKLLSLQ